MRTGREDRSATGRCYSADCAAVSGGAADNAAVRPLSMSQLKQFIRDGYLVMQIDGVPEGFHERVFAKAHVSRALCCLLSVMARCIAC